MKSLLALLAIAALVRGGALAQTVPTFDFSDGAVATVYPHCGDSELCATIAYKDGETVKIYSEGAAYGQPYVLHFTRVNATGTIYQYSRIARIQYQTELTMDRGRAHLEVDQNADGTLTLSFVHLGK